jgi:hypothetical protein
MSHEYNGYDMPDTFNDIEKTIDGLENKTYDSNSWYWILTLRIIIAIFRSKHMPYGGE